MTRFDAATADTRQELFVDAIRAHTERDSTFLTIEATTVDADGTDDTSESDDATHEVGGTGDEADATDTDGPPWVQYADGTLNLDCTDDELDRLKSLLDEFPSFTIDDLATPDEADGTNVRVMARTDDERVGEFVDRVFRQVYDRSDGYRAWVTAV